MSTCLALSVMWAAVASLRVSEVTHASLMSEVVGLPEVVSSDDGKWLYTGGNGVIDVMSVSGRSLTFMNTVTSGASCPKVQGLKRHNEWLFMLCVTTVEVFDASNNAMPVHSGHIPLNRGNGVAMDIDVQRSHMWVLAEDVNYELQQYDIAASNLLWSTADRLLDAINLALPPKHTLSDLAIHITGDTMVLTTSALTQQWDLTVITNSPKLSNHKHIALGTSLTVLSLPYAAGVTVIEVYPITSIKDTPLQQYDVPFDVTDLAILDGIIFASDANDRVWYVDSAKQGKGVESILTSKTGTVKLSVLRTLGWVVASSAKDITVLQQVHSNVAFNNVHGTAVVDGLVDVPAKLVGSNVYAPVTSFETDGTIEILCSTSSEGCSVVLSVYHCPPCSAKVNGNLPNVLLSKGWVGGSCAPRFYDTATDFNQPTVSFHTVLTPGEVVTLRTSLPTRFVVAFLTESPLQDWCPKSQPQGHKTLPMPPNPCISKCAVI